MKAGGPEMARVFASPRKYIQGYDELSRLKKHLANIGKSVFVLASESRLTELKNVILTSFKDTDVSVTFAAFGGECSKQEVDRLKKAAEANQCDVIVGMGGGKAIDTAKALAYYQQLPVVIVPTVASCDAPTSQVVIFYNENGNVEDVLLTRRNPDIVLVDTRVIANSPVRLLVAGMGDALATFFEARTCVEACRRNLVGGTATLTSFALAELCYKTLLADGPAAKMAAENRVATKALENIVEANILLSGLGFESNGVSTAHAIYDGFMTMPGTHNKYHGEWVAFGTIVLLVLEHRPQPEIEEVVKFCASVGLPTTLKDLGQETIKREELFKVAEAVCAPKRSIHNEPFPVTADDVLAALLVADSVGRQAQS
jgi:Glycerol dehydrogenase and related enzymes